MKPRLQVYKPHSENDNMPLFMMLINVVSHVSLPTFASLAKKHKVLDMS